MMHASARGVRRYIRLKGSNNAKEFQKVLTEDWLDENLKEISWSADSGQ